jgi:hypothetical protein
VVTALFIVETYCMFRLFHKVVVKHRVKNIRENRFCVKRALLKRRTDFSFLQIVMLFYYIGRNCQNLSISHVVEQYLGYVLSQYIKIIYIYTYIYVYIYIYIYIYISRFRTVTVHLNIHTT